MRINFGTLFHRKSKDKRMDGLVTIPDDSSLWPPSWKEVEYKTYDRFPKVALPQAVPKKFGHIELLKRKSVRFFGIREKGVVHYKALLLQAASNVLYYSCGEMKGVGGGTPKRIQASAGGRYPIEVYIINFEEGDLKQSWYHYNVKEHALEKLWDTHSIPREDIPKLFNYSWSKDASFGIILSAVVKRSTLKYGERGYRYIYLEAGEIIMNMQYNLMLEGYSSVVVGGMNDEIIENMLDLDGEDETVIIGLVAG